MPAAPLPSATIRPADQRIDRRQERIGLEDQFPDLLLLHVREYLIVALKPQVFCALEGGPEGTLHAARADELFG